MPADELEVRPDDDVLDRVIGPETESGEPPRGLHVSYREQYESEFPHPRHLSEYQRLHADSPRIIFESFEKQGDHRREMEKKLLAGSEHRANLGQFLGTGILALVVILGFVTVITGQAIAGSTMVGGALATGVLVFVFGYGGRNK